MKKLLLITLFILSLLSCSKDNICNIYQRTREKHAKQPYIIQTTAFEGKISDETK